MRTNRSAYGLDSCALIAYLRGEPGADAVAPVIEATRPTIHALNLCEVYYDCVRAVGRDNAMHLLADARSMVNVEEGVDPNFMIVAGDLKARGGIALPDCIAAALAIPIGGNVLTADCREFAPLDAQGLCSMEFFR